MCSWLLQKLPPHVKLLLKDSTFVKNDFDLRNYFSISNLHENSFNLKEKSFDVCSYIKFAINTIEKSFEVRFYYKFAFLKIELQFSTSKIGANRDLGAMSSVTKVALKSGFNCTCGKFFCRRIVKQSFFFLIFELD